MTQHKSQALNPIGVYPTDPFFPDTPMTVTSPFIDDDTFLEIVRKTVIAGLDVVPLLERDGAVEQKLYLAHRISLPMSGIWTIGGRLMFNDFTPAEGIARCAKRETKMDIDPSRFKHINANFCGWGKVAQGNFAGKSLAPLFCVVLNPDEMTQISASLSPKEYEPGFGLQGYDRERLLAEGCHPILVDTFDRLFPGPVLLAEMIRLAGIPIWER